MKKVPIKKELRDFAESVIRRCWEITERREYVYETLSHEIKSEFLTEDQVFEVEDFLDQLDEEINENHFLVADLYGLYEDEYNIPYKVHYSEVVIPSCLTDSFNYKQGVIKFDVTFEIVAIEYTEWDSFALSPETFQDKLLHFTELTQEEYDAYEE